MWPIRKPFQSIAVFSLYLSTIPPSINHLLSTHSGPMASTWSICRGNRASSSSARQKIPSASGWSSLKWPCMLEPQCQNYTGFCSLITISHVRLFIHTGQTLNPKEPLPTSTTSKCTRLKRTPTAEPVKCCWGEGSLTQPPFSLNYRCGNAVNWDGLRPMLLVGYWFDLYYMSCFTDWLYWLVWNHTALT